MNPVALLAPNALWAPRPISQHPRLSRTAQPVPRIHIDQKTMMHASRAYMPCRLKGPDLMLIVRVYRASSAALPATQDPERVRRVQQAPTRTPRERQRV